MPAPARSTRGRTRASPARQTRASGGCAARAWSPAHAPTLRDCPLLSSYGCTATLAMPRLHCNPGHAAAQINSRCRLALTLKHGNANASKTCSRGALTASSRGPCQQPYPLTLIQAVKHLLELRPHLAQRHAQLPQQRRVGLVRARRARRRARLGAAAAASTAPGATGSCKCTSPQYQWAAWHQLRCSQAQHRPL